MEKVKERPSLSMVMTTFNLERYVGDALHSVLNIRYDGEMQLIIVDDASTDRTTAIIDEILAKDAEGWEVVFIKREENGGVAAALDSGLFHASNEWIICIDGDDIQHPLRAEKTAELISRYPDAGMIAMSAELIDSNGVMYGKMAYGEGNYEDVPGVLYLDSPEERIKNCTQACGRRLLTFGCAMAISRELYHKWGNLCRGSEKQRFAQDPTWELRAVLSGPVLGSKYIACQYRTHSNNLLNRTWGGGVRGIMDMERFHARYQTHVAAAHKKQLSDILRAGQDATLTDCSAEDRERLREYIARELKVAELRSNWWSISWIKRLKRALHSADYLPGHMKNWAWCRLMPLWLLAFIKSKR